MLAQRISADERAAARTEREASEKNGNSSVGRRKKGEGARGVAEVGDLTCYDGPENENNETKQCRADVTVN